jgi:hypothetical protein
MIVYIPCIKIRQKRSFLTDERRKALVEPEVIPPLHRGKVAEPLVCKLVCDLQPAGRATRGKTTER